jgi:hypothetical protein
MNIDFSNVDVSKTFSVYDKGVYTVRIKSIEETEAKSGNPQLLVKAAFVGGKYDEKPYTEYITLIDSCSWKLGKFIAGLGFDLKTLGNFDTQSGDFRKLLNKCINKTTCWVIDVAPDRNKVDRNNVVDYQVDPNAKPTSSVMEDEPEFLKTETTSDAVPTDIAWDEK